MGIIDEIVYGYYAKALEPVFEHMQNQFQEMHEETQRVALAQLVMEHEYEIQELKKKQKGY